MVIDLEAWVGWNYYAVFSDADNSDSSKVDHCTTTKNLGGILDASGA
jgi:hypothetical protein